MTTTAVFERAAVAMRGTARRSARARKVGVLAGLLGLLAACQGPGATPGAAPQEPASTAAASPAASAAPSAPPATSAVPAASAPLAASAAPAAPGAKAGCVADADCRTHASYCVDAPCACQVLRAADPEPRCAAGSPQVACLVNPCARKAAACQAGRCVLVPGG